MTSTSCLPFAVTPCYQPAPDDHYSTFVYYIVFLRRVIDVESCCVVVSVCLHVMLLSLTHAGPQQAAVPTTVPTLPHHGRQLCSAPYCQSRTTPCVYYTMCVLHHTCATPCMCLTMCVPYHVCPTPCLCLTMCVSHHACTYTMRELHHACATPGVCHTMHVPHHVSYTVRVLHYVCPTPCVFYTMHVLHHACTTPCVSYTVHVLYHAVLHHGSTVHSSLPLTVSKRQALLTWVLLLCRLESVSKYSCATLCGCVSFSFRYTGLDFLGQLVRLHLTLKAPTVFCTVTVHFAFIFSLSLSIVKITREDIINIIYFFSHSH